MGTQNKEVIFNQYLFVQQPGVDESLWTQLIDTDRNYSFEVETNFTYIHLKQIDSQITQASSEADIAQIKAQNLIEQYVNASFMGASERFNSAMVFETLPDKLQMGIGQGQKPGASSTAATDSKLQKLMGQRHS